MIKKLIRTIKNIISGPVRISPEEMQEKRREYEKLAEETKEDK